MEQQIDGERFITLLTNRYPKVVVNVDESSRDSVHMAMGALARATQISISEEDLAAVNEYFAFIAEVFCLATPEVKNAVFVSYLECLSFDGRHGKRIKARDLLSPRLQAGLRGLEAYNAALFPK